MPTYVPMVYETTARGEERYDIFSRLIKERIVFITGQIDEILAEAVIAQLIYLEYQDADKDITIYINSPGGSVNAGLAIYDTMQFVKPDIQTMCVGQCASMGAVLLAAGTKGKRFALPHSRIMIHQPLGGASGQAADIAIQATEIVRIKETLSELLAKHTGKHKDSIRQDTDRNNYMSARSALEYGIIDEILENRQ